MRGPRLFDHTDWNSKKGLHALRCPVFTENIDDNQKTGLHIIGCPVFTENVGEDHFLRGPRHQPA